MNGYFFLIIISFLTSAFNAAVGIGGGFLLIAIMTSFLPPSALVPVHGVVMLASNVSRNFFNFKFTDWEIFPAFLAGVAIGTAVGSQAIIVFPIHYLPLALAFFILLMTWLPDLLKRVLSRGNFFFLGFLQGSLTLLLGSTGSLNFPFLLRKKLNRDTIIATSSLLMTITHLIKILTYGLLGFNFGEYIPLTVGMITAVTIGSYAGTRVRGRIPEYLSQQLFKILITSLACGMIVNFYI